MFVNEKRKKQKNISEYRGSGCLLQRERERKERKIERQITRQRMRIFGREREKDRNKDRTIEDENAW